MNKLYCEVHGAHMRFSILVEWISKQMDKQTAYIVQSYGLRMVDLPLKTHKKISYLMKATQEN